MADPTNPTSPGAGSSTSVDPRVVQNVNSALQEQARILTQLNAAIAQMAEALTQMDQEDRNGVLDPSKWDDLKKHIDDANDSAAGGQGVLGKLTGAFGKVSGMIMGPIGGAFSFLGKGLGMATDALGGLVSMGGNFLSFLGDAVSGIFNLSMSIISIPFKIMAKLFEMAASTPGDNSYAKALQAIVKSYGALGSVGPKAIVAVSKSMDKFSSDGRSALMVWGNLAQRTEAVLKFAEELGPQFERNIDAFKENGEMFMRFQKGLALSGEAMQAMFQRAEAAGQKPEKVLTNIHKIAKGLGKEFKIDAKIISRDMGKAMQDLAHFGHLSDIELGIAATLANKLGVSVEKLTGVMDQTMTFDQAAEAAAKLNEQFHTNIEVMDLLKAENPGDILDVYRKGFAEAGIDLSKMDMRTRAFIKSTTNMSDELFQSIASGKNMAITTASIRKEAEKAEKAIVSETQALKELNPQIDMMIPDSGQMPKSLLEGIMEGIDRSFKMMPEFKGLMTNLRAILKDSIAFGMKIGDLLKEIPGIRDIIGGLQDMFNPKNWHRMFDRLLGAFRNFANDGYRNFDKLVDDIWGALSGLFGDSAPGAQRLWKGVKSFFEFFESLVRRGITWVNEKIANGINWLSDWLPKQIDVLLSWLRNPSAKLDFGSFKTPGVISEWGKVFDPLIPAMNNFMEKAFPAIKALFDELMDRVGNWLQENLSKIFESPVFWLAVFGPGVGKWAISAMVSRFAAAKTAETIASSLAGPLTQSLTGAISSALGTAATQAAGSAAATTAGNVVGSTVANVATTAVTGAAASAATTAATTAIAAGGVAAAEGVAVGAVAAGGAAATAGAAATTAAINWWNPVGWAAAVIAASAAAYMVFAEREMDDLTKLNEQYENNAFQQSLSSAATTEDKIKLLQQNSKKLEAAIEADNKWWEYTDSEYETLLKKRLADQRQQQEELMKQLVAEQDTSSEAYFAKMRRESEERGKKRKEEYQQAVLNNLGVGDGKPLDVGKLQEIMASYDSFLVELNNMNLQQKIDEVKEKLSTVDFTILHENQEDALFKSVAQLAAIGDVFGHIKTVGDNIVAAKDAIFTMLNSLAQNGGAFWAALGPEGMLSFAVDYLTSGFIVATDGAAIASEVEQQTKAVAGIAGLATTVSTSVSQLQQTFYDMSGFLADPMVQQVAANKEVPGFAESAEGIFAAVNAMVEQTQLIDYTLGNLEPFNLAARLQPIADGMGFGGKFAYTVNGGWVQVSVDLHVHMDAADLETTLIMRKSSFVRDRINFALANSTDTEAGNKGLLKTYEDPNTQKLSSVP